MLHRNNALDINNYNSFSIHRSLAIKNGIAGVLFNTGTELLLH